MVGAGRPVRLIAVVMIQAEMMVTETKRNAQELRSGYIIKGYILKGHSIQFTKDWMKGVKDTYWL